ncbi:SNARE associated Golgi protein family domain-containing protein, putative [Eimeria acervulina]|uniref:SNARE associated Golgi protein family domain-containing protein, putative n=1 Tax=Eimeria acervulina TaxID=5801 RepID=U6GHW0_EIMAC|nr:SNARE associated Golgi protein family domain-containing protein, putative [Eimeria acervulina]CDI79755.1 SNARE associated Golgi protein family domain-containing protein, putative [Eimeria acervulina]
MLPFSGPWRAREHLFSLPAAASAATSAAAAAAAAAGLAMAVTLLLGALYSPLIAFSITSLLSAVGPSLAYYLFKAAGKPFVVRFFPKQLQRMRRLIHPRQSSSNSSIDGSTSSSKSKRSSSSSTHMEGEVHAQVEAAAQDKLLPQQQQQQQQHQPNAWEAELDLMLTVLFLRISPFPNLVINAASPVLDVPFRPFFIATWLGLMPNSALFGKS